MTGALIEHVDRVIATVRYRDAIGTVECPLVSEVPSYREATFMHRRVVLRAQQHQVVERGLATVRPVHHVVDVQEAFVTAARE